MDSIPLYLAVGAGVTGADLLIYNALAKPPFGWGRLRAHCMATLCSMALGFTLHFAVVFRPDELLLGERLLRYVGTVMISDYVVQTLIIHFLSQRWTVPALAFGRLGQAGSSQLFSEEFCARNIVKLCAVVAGMTVNYVSFKYFVYG
jgi:putative flippase GtrA